MQKTLKFLAKGLVIGEIIVVLLPLTLGFLLLIYLALQTLISIILGNATAPNMEIVLMYFVVAIFEALAGYGLFSLWWLALNYAKVSIKDIPKYVVYGLIVGAGINLIMIANQLSPGLVFSSGKLPLIYSPVIIYFFGPLLVIFTLTSLMWMKKRYGWI